jgi:hypothetical protein
VRRNNKEDTLQKKWILNKVVLMGKRKLTVEKSKCFTGELFNEDDQAEKAAHTIKGLQYVRSFRILDITREMQRDS